MGRNGSLPDRQICAQIRQFDKYAIRSNSLTNMRSHPTVWQICAQIRQFDKYALRSHSLTNVRWNVTVWQIYHQIQQFDKYALTSDSFTNVLSDLTVPKCMPPFSQPSSLPVLQQSCIYFQNENSLKTGNYIVDWDWVLCRRERYFRDNKVEKLPISLLYVDNILNPFYTHIRYTPSSGLLFDGLRLNVCNYLEFDLLVVCIRLTIIWGITARCKYPSCYCV